MKIHLITTAITVISFLYILIRMISGNLGETFQVIIVSLVGIFVLLQIIFMLTEIIKVRKKLASK